MKNENKLLSTIYEIFICLLVLVSIVFVFLDTYSVISLDTNPYRFLDLSLLGFFWIDYIIRFIKSTDKIKFFKSNIFDLIAIIPLNEFFALFRIARIFRLSKLMKLIKLTRLLKCLAFIVVFKNKLSRFLSTNGFIYMIYCCLALVLSSSILMSYVEHQNFADSLWWSIVTCTTVGYGDISPTSTIGRFVAIILMLFGIGFIGMLTSTITTYFTSNRGNNETSQPENIDLINLVESLTPKQQSKLLSIALMIKNNSYDKIYPDCTGEEK